MQQINLQAVPSQEFTININGIRYDFRFKFISGSIIAYDLQIDEEYVAQGFRVTPGEMLIVYRHQEIDGNFYLFVPEDQDVDYEQLGVSQILYYLTADEVAEVRSGD
jgi:hypothetical protein